MTVGTTMGDGLGKGYALGLGWGIGANASAKMGTPSHVTSANIFTQKGNFHAEI